MFTACATAPTVSSTDAISEIPEIINATGSSLEAEILQKGELDESDYVYMNREPEYYSPFDCYSIELNAGEFVIELRSLGNMFGFSKSIMIPVITVFDEQGNIINTTIKSYEVRSNNMKYPVHIYTLQGFVITEAQKVFIMVNADISSEDRVVSSGYGMMGVIPYQVTIPLNRSPYAKYEITVE